MTSNPRFHCGGATNTGVNAAKIVVREMQRHSRFQVRQFLAEGIR
jgi:hypothetical protein